LLHIASYESAKAKQRRKNGVIFLFNDKFWHIFGLFNTTYFFNILLIIYDKGVKRHFLF